MGAGERARSTGRGAHHAVTVPGTQSSEQSHLENQKLDSGSLCSVKPLNQAVDVPGPSWARLSAGKRPLSGTAPVPSATDKLEIEKGFLQVGRQNRPGFFLKTREHYSLKFK